MSYHPPRSLCPDCRESITSQQMTRHRGSARCEANQRRQAREDAARFSCVVNVERKKYRHRPCGMVAVSTSTGRPLCRTHARKEADRLHDQSCAVEVELGIRKALSGACQKCGLFEGHWPTCPDRSPREGPGDTHARQS